MFVRTLLENVINGENKNKINSCVHAVLILAIVFKILFPPFQARSCSLLCLFFFITRSISLSTRLFQFSRQIKFTKIHNDIFEHGIINVKNVHRSFACAAQSKFFVNFGNIHIRIRSCRIIIYAQHTNIFYSP